VFTVNVSIIKVQKNINVTELQVEHLVMITIAGYNQPGHSQLLRSVNSQLIEILHSLSAYAQRTRVVLVPVVI